MGGLGACCSCGLLCNISHGDVVWLQLKKAELRLPGTLSFFADPAMGLNEFD